MSLWKKFLGKTKKTAVEWFTSGDAYLVADNYEQAINDYTQAIALDPKYIDAYYNRGLAYSKSGQHEQAIRDYTQAVTINPQDAEAYINRGVVYEKSGQYEQAIHDYTQAITLNPQIARAYYNRGVAYRKLEQDEQALDDYTQALTLNPKYVEAYTNREVIYLKREQYKEAIRDHTQALSLRTGLPFAKLQHIFLFTNKDGESILSSELTISINSQVPVTIVRNSTVGKLIGEQQQPPDKDLLMKIQLEIQSGFQDHPNILKGFFEHLLTLYYDAFVEPKTQETVGIVLIYEKPDMDLLIQLLAEANNWGRNNGWPAFKEYPQYEQIRSIGERIHCEGGLEAMQRTYDYLQAQNPTIVRSSLEHFWYGVGDWLS